MNSPGGVLERYLANLGRRLSSIDNDQPRIANSLGLGQARKPCTLSVGDQVVHVARSRGESLH